jgi:PTH2 family peptidyl-tRNA hydrolase
MKQAIIARTDVQMGRGKLAAQVAHAAVAAADAAASEIRQQWKQAGQKKIVLQISSKEDVFTHVERAERDGLPTAVIRDAGHTQIEPETITCAGIGPGPDADVDQITGDLSLY